MTIKKILIILFASIVFVSGCFFVWIKNDQSLEFEPVEDIPVTPIIPNEIEVTDDSNKITNNSITTKPPVSETVYEFYTSKDSGISFEYKKSPSGYMIKEDGPIESQVTSGPMIVLAKASEVENAKSEEDFSSGIIISTYNDYPDYEGVSMSIMSSSLEWAKSEYRTNFPQRINKEYKLITIGGKTAVSYSSPRQPIMISGEPYKRADGSIAYIEAYKSIAVVHDGKGTVITLSYKDLNDPIHADFDKLLASIKFIK